MLNFLGKVVVPPGTSRNNTNNTAAYLAGAGNYNATVAAYPASAADGAAGNLWTFALTGDSGTGVRITVNPTAKTILVLYQSGVSTVTLVNAAIAALTGANKVLRVELAGTGANVLTAPGHDIAATPLAGGADDAFVLRPTTRAFQAQTTGDDLVAELSCDTVSPSTFATTAATGNVLFSAGTADFPSGHPGCAPVFAAFNSHATARETVLIYANS